MRKLTTRRQFLENAFSAICMAPGAAVLTGCASTPNPYRAERMPDYSNVDGFLGQMDKAFDAGRAYALDNKRLVPVPTNVYAARQRMLDDTTAPRGWMGALNMDWADKILDVKGKSRDEQLAYGAAMLEGSLQGLWELKEQDRKYQEIYDDAVAQINQGFNRYHPRGRRYVGIQEPRRIGPFRDDPVHGWDWSPRR